MKTQHLLETLTVKEIRNFQNSIIKTHKRESLKRLFNYIYKHEIIDKEKLFKYTFQQKYETKKDTLLRNELRLLNQEIEQFLVQEITAEKFDEKSVFANLELLKLYANRKQEKLFQPLWKKLYKRANEERLYLLKNQLVHLYFDYSTQTSELNYELFVDLETQLLQAVQDTRAYNEELLQRLYLKIALTQRNLLALNPKHKCLDYKSLPQKENENQDFIQYITSLSESYSMKGFQKIERLKQCINYASILDDYEKYADLKDAVLVIEMNIGLEYFILGDYEKAYSHYQKIIDKCNQLPLKKRAIIYYNYMFCLVGLEAYEEVLDWYTNIEKDWLEIKTIQYRIPMVLTWAYIMLGQYKSAYPLLLNSLNHIQSHNDQIYGRVLLSIMYYEDGELELAEREIYNLKQKHNYQQFLEQVFGQYIQLFNQHLQIIYLVDKEKKISRLKKIQEILNEIIQSRYSSIFFCRWLYRKNEKLLKGLA